MKTNIKILLGTAIALYILVIVGMSHLKSNLRTYAKATFHSQEMRQDESCEK